MLAAIVSTLVMVQGIILVVLELRPGTAACPRCWGRHEPPPAVQHLGLAAYLRVIPQARRVLAPPAPAAPSPADAEARQVSDSTVLVRVDLQE
jgi:hypothetical protein